MRKRIALSAVALLCAAGTATAAPITLPSGEPIYGQYGNMEQFSATNSVTGPPGYAAAATTCSVAVHCGDWGVLLISTLQHGGVVDPNLDISGGTPFFTDGGKSGNQITGIFWGFKVEPGDPTEASGGFLDLYWHDNGAGVDAACLAGGCLPDAATVGKFGSGTFLARLNFASGIDPESDVTQKANIAPSVGNGHSDGFLNVDTSVPGAWTSALNTQWFIPHPDPGCPSCTFFGNRDIRFSSFFNVDLGSWFVPGTDIVGLRSNDPVRGFTTSTVPEPATLTLLGMGLASLGYRRRKKA